MTRTAPALLAAAALAIVWLVPLGLAPFRLHMLRHMTLVAIAAPLIVMAWPGFWSRAGLPALAAAAVEFIVVWGWHLPGPHMAARLSTPWFLAEQASFLGAGLLVWGGALAAPPLLGALALLLTSMHMTLLGALLVLAGRPLLDPTCTLDDQRVGGLVMLGIGTPVYLVAGLLLTGRALRLEPAR